MTKQTLWVLVLSFALAGPAFAQSAGGGAGGGAGGAAAGAGPGAAGTAGTAAGSNAAAAVSQGLGGGSTAQPAAPPTSNNSGAPNASPNQVPSTVGVAPNSPAPSTYAPANGGGGAVSGRSEGRAAETRDDRQGKVVEQEEREVSRRIRNICKGC